jgi:hypothetical protein
VGRCCLERMVLCDTARRVGAVLGLDNFFNKWWHYYIVALLSLLTLMHSFWIVHCFSSPLTLTTQYLHLDHPLFLFISIHFVSHPFDSIVAIVVYYRYPCWQFAVRSYVIFNVFHHTLSQCAHNISIPV